MSRIGKLPVSLPAGVELTIDENNNVTVKGPKGTMTEQISKLVNIKLEDGVLTVSRDKDDKTPDLSTVWPEP